MLPRSSTSTVNVAIALLLLLSTLFYYGHCQTAPPEARVPPTIAYGNPTNVGEFPFLVNIEEFNESKGEWYSICTGSLIDSRTVLTAAHCVAYLLIDDEDEDDYGGREPLVPVEGVFTPSKTGKKDSNVRSGDKKSDKKKGKGQKNKKGSKGKKNKGGQKHESATCRIPKGPSLRVLVGNNSTTTKNAIQRGVARVVPHPMYVKNACAIVDIGQSIKVGYDVGLLFLDSPIHNLKTIELSAHKVEIRERTYPLGYGNNEGDNTGEFALTKTLSVAKKCPSKFSPDQYCGAANRTGLDYKEAFKKFKGIDGWSEDLAEELKEYITLYHGYYSAICSGDSGGPALMNLPKQSLASLSSWQQVGINSWTGQNDRCGYYDSKTTIGYTRVAHYIGWIRRIVSSYYKEKKLPLAKMFNPLQRHSSSGVHLVPGPPPPLKECKVASVKTDRCKSTFYPLPQVRRGNRQRHLIGVSSSSARSIAKYFCQSLYFRTAGAIGTFKVKRGSKINAYNLTTGKTCSGESCKAIGIIECVPHGAKRCPKDKSGNIGSKNQGGSNNIGNGNSGDSNWGSCNKGKNNIGYNDKGVSNK